MYIDMFDPVGRECLEGYCHHARIQGKKIGFTTGVFDLFHFYHLNYFERCREHIGRNGVLVVGADSDKLVKQVKGTLRPIFNEHHRVRILDALKYVDVSFIMHSLDMFRDMVDLIDPHMIFKNEDFIGVDVYTGKFEFRKSELIIIPDIKEIQSTTEFINKIIELNNNKDKKI